MCPGLGRVGAFTAQLMPIKDNGVHPIAFMKSPLPWRGCLPGKEVIRVLHQLCLKLVEEQDLVSFNDKGWDFAVSSLFHRVYAGTSELTGVV